MRAIFKFVHMHSTPGPGPVTASLIASAGLPNCQCFVNAAAGGGAGAAAVDPPDL